MNEDYTIDSLTNLKTTKALVDDHENCDNLIICVLDINHFQEINKTLGFNAGLFLLEKIARVLKEHKFNCYKLADDKFAIANTAKADRHEIEVFCSYLFELLVGETFMYKEDEIIVTISMGIAASKEPISSESEILDLLYNADYALKHAEKNDLIFSIYDEELANFKANQDNFNWKSKIYGSLKKNEIITYFQPIINNKTGEVEKYEALVRMKDDEQKLISPDEFLKPSKKYRLYNYLTREVFSQVLNEIMVNDCEISINVSIEDIREFLRRKFVINRLKNFPKADKLVFELLETEKVKDYEEVRLFIKQIKTFGCKIALDDFGSGYSNFNHVLNLDIDYIKIDSTIIKHVDNDENAERVAKLIVDYAKTVNAKTIAEFVYSKKVYEKVKDLGVDYSQGFYLGKPKSKIPKK